MTKPNCVCLVVCSLAVSTPSVLSAVSGCYMTGVQITNFTIGGLICYVLACDELTDNHAACRVGRGTFPLSVASCQFPHVPPGVAEFSSFFSRYKSVPSFTFRPFISNAHVTGHHLLACGAKLGEGHCPLAPLPLKSTYD